MFGQWVRRKEQCFIYCFWTIVQLPSSLVAIVWFLGEYKTKKENSIGTEVDGEWTYCNLGAFNQKFVA